MLASNNEIIEEFSFSFSKHPREWHEGERRGMGRVWEGGYGAHSGVKMSGCLIIVP